MIVILINSIHALTRYCTLRVNRFSLLFFLPEADDMKGTSSDALGRSKKKRKTSTVPGRPRTSSKGASFTQKKKAKGVTQGKKAKGVTQRKKAISKCVICTTEISSWNMIVPSSDKDKRFATSRCTECKQDCYIC